MTQRNVPGVRGHLGVKWLTPGNMKLLEMTSMNQRLWVHPGKFSVPAGAQRDLFCVTNTTHARLYL